MDNEKQSLNQVVHNCDEKTCRGYFKDVYEFIGTELDKVYGYAAQKLSWKKFAFIMILILSMIGASFEFTSRVSNESKAMAQEFRAADKELSEKLAKLADEDDLERWKDDIKELIQEIKE